MRILFFTHPGTNSLGILQDIAWGFERLGHHVFNLSVGPFWQWRKDHADLRAGIDQGAAYQIHRFIEDNNIDMSVAMWGNMILTLPVVPKAANTVRAFFDEIGHYHLQYWWDAPHWFEHQCALQAQPSGIFSGDYQIHYINNRYTGAEMAELLKFSNVFVSSNAVNPDRFKPHPEFTREYDLVFFSGGGDRQPTQVMLEELEKNEPDVDRIRHDVAIQIQPQIEEFCKRFPDNQRPMIAKLMDAMVDQRLADRHMPAILQLQNVVHANGTLAEAANELIATPLHYVDATQLVRQIENWERPFMVAYLSRHFDCLRVGQQSYETWGIEGDQTELVPYHEQSKLYAKAAFALNVMRWQDDCSMNSKAFEITGCRCGTLQAYRGGVEDLFEADKEMLIFRTPAEAREKLAYALANPSFAGDLREAGYRRTLSEHTWAHRMKSVADFVAQRLRQDSPVHVEQDPKMPLFVSAERIERTGNGLAFMITLVDLDEPTLAELETHPRLCVVDTPKLTNTDLSVEANQALIKAMFEGKMPASANIGLGMLHDDLELARDLMSTLPRAKFIIVCTQDQITRDVTALCERIADRALSIDPNDLPPGIHTTAQLICNHIGVDYFEAPKNTMMISH